jgi:hypothetical protein
LSSWLVHGPFLHSSSCFPQQAASCPSAINGAAQHSPQLALPLSRKRTPGADSPQCGCCFRSFLGDICGAGRTERIKPN